jgi:hypothetical protein
MGFSPYQWTEVFAFFTLIYPGFQADGLSPKQEFLTFFIPYAAAMTLEIHQLIKILNRE